VNKEFSQKINNILLSKTTVEWNRLHIVYLHFDYESAARVFYQNDAQIKWQPVNSSWQDLMDILAEYKFKMDAESQEELTKCVYVLNKDLSHQIKLEYGPQDMTVYDIPPENI